MVGIGSTALDWIRSFLSGRTQLVVYGGEQSVTSVVLFGVSQGSVLGPLLFVLYTALLFNVIAQHQVDAHQYADDLQLYLWVPPSEASVATDRLPMRSRGGSGSCRCHHPCRYRSAVHSRSSRRE